MEKKKSSIGYIIVIILLILGFGGYILFDQGLIKLDAFNKKSEVKEEAKKEELDVNSRLVQSLYNMVTDSDDSYSYTKYWVYSDRGEDQGKIKDFFVDKASEEMKMNIVGLNLSESDKNTELCSDISIPAKKDGRYSLCELHRLYDSGMSRETYYTRSYIETLYKTIFGKDAKLDTSVSIATDWARGSAFNYIEEYDAYFEYQAEGVGGTFPPGGYEGVVAKALKDEDKLIIYENVKFTSYQDYDESNQPNIDEFYYVYTFELEDDGMYKFVSRVKEAK